MAKIDNGLINKLIQPGSSYGQSGNPGNIVLAKFQTLLSAPDTVVSAFVAGVTD